MKSSYPEYKSLNMPAIEAEVLSSWRQHQTFAESIKHRQGAESFVFYEGPPSANGLPGIHHVISRTLKDLVCRFKTMQGYQVNRKAGWDTHGLPVELGVEKELGITKEDIGVTISVEDYNAKCREAVMRYKKEWEQLTEQMGYWVDMDQPYVTFEPEYMETLWWCLKELFDKDLLYKSVSIQPYSPAAGTGLSSHELNQPGCYREVKDATATVMFRARRTAESEFLFKDIAATEGVYFLAWTTTPWTLPSNTGLTVGPDIDYVLVRTIQPLTHQPVNVVLAKALLSKWFAPEGENGIIEDYQSGDKPLPWKIINEFKGRDLLDVRYEQLLPYEGNGAEVAGGDPWRVILGDFVTTEDGTGIVHTAPAFGADDFRAGKKYNIGILTLVDREGKFLDTMKPVLQEGMPITVAAEEDISGKFVKNYKDDPNYRSPDKIIINRLKREGTAWHIDYNHLHSYPHCWRTDKPIIYYPLDAWFVRTTAMKDRMVELNKTINWKPAATGEGRFGNWLENMVDWNLSRSRFWGTPLPIWVSEDGLEVKCIGSIDELEREVAFANEKLSLNQFLEPFKTPDGDTARDSFSPEGYGVDLHKPWVDQIVLATKDGKPMRREPDLIDVWFDSGAMPYAQWGLPKVSKGHRVTADEMRRHVAERQGSDGNQISADFIAEGVDQTRGWFYTLHALAVMLFDDVAYKTVISNGLVLDKNGNKMSKRLGNAVDPFQTIGTLSADATRWYLITNAAPWDSLKFDVEGIREVQRKFFGTLFNTYQFFALYANVDGFTFKETYIPIRERSELDRWILSELHTLVKTVGHAFDNYEPTQAGRAIEYFLDELLSNWYVRLSRRRFWKGEYQEDKIAAYQTLYECLETISLLMAPVAPFYADWLYRNLNDVTGRCPAKSVHLADFPNVDEQMIDRELETRMHLAQDISSLILSLRKRVNIKVRQPLQKAAIPVRDEEERARMEAMSGLIQSEVNIKELVYLTEENGLIHKKLKANFKTLGSRMGPHMKRAAQLIAEATPAQIAALEKDGSYQIEIDGAPYDICLNDVTVLTEDIPGWVVASKGALTVALDTEISKELAAEGIARELVNRIQKLRKDSGLAVTDRIDVKIEESAHLKDAVMKFLPYICGEILADKLEFGSILEDGMSVEVNENPVTVRIIKVDNTN